jgi:hypothetical protein
MKKCKIIKKDNKFVGVEFNTMPNNILQSLLENFASYYTDYKIKLDPKIIHVNFDDKIITLCDYYGQDGRWSKIFGTLLGMAYWSNNHQANEDEALIWSKATFEKLDDAIIFKMIKQKNKNKSQLNKANLNSTG